MYKVFINDKPIIITSSVKNNKQGFLAYPFTKFVFNDIINNLSNYKVKGIYVKSTNLENDWEKFKKNFKVVTAAGGLVVNKKNEILFIFRDNKWDLPKGHKEKGEKTKETAIREVQEECGIANIKIDRFLIKTHHIFHKNKEVILKETHWYLMSSGYSGSLTPQLEEGITEVAFKKKTEIPKVFLNTYGNIKMVYDAYLELLG